MNLDENAVRSAESAHDAMVIPVAPDTIAEEISAVGVEGRPADPKSGPGILRTQLWGIGAVVLLAAVGVGLWQGIGWGFAMLGIGAVGTLCNPVVGAIFMRASDRARVVVQGLTEHKVEVRGKVV